MANVTTYVDLDEYKTSTEKGELERGEPDLGFERSRAGLETRPYCCHLSTVLNARGTPLGTSARTNRYGAPGRVVPLVLRVQNSATLATRNSCYLLLVGQHENKRGHFTGRHPP